jgi:hypothetical protein
VSSGYEDRQLFAGWVIWLVRLGLVAGSAFALWGAARGYADFQAIAAADVPSEPGRFWTVVGLFVVAGLALGLAVRIPFPRPRTAWGRIVFVVIALAPAAHLWTLVGLDAAPDFLRHPFWFDEWPVVQASAVLAGVAVASAVGARRGKV